MYSNSLQTPFNSFTATPTLPDRSPAALPILRPLDDHHYWIFFRQAELATGQQFNEAERKLLKELSKIKKLRKRQYFLQADDQCRYIGFITKGAVKTYSINERGQESIIAFAMENEWVTDLESFLGRQPSNFHIEALEDLEMILLDLDQLNGLIETVPAFNAFISCFQKKQLVESQKRINAALSMTAEERYDDLLKNKPGYTQRFSQNMLALYLGIKPETLCRLRKH